MSLNLFDLTGKRALITGSTGGLGMAMAKGLGQAGATLIINGHSSKEKVNNALKEYSSSGLSAYGYFFDVTDPEAVENQVTKIENEIGPIDILVNNAGIVKRSALEEMDLSDFKHIIQVNLTGVFIMSKYVVKRMIARKSGKIINICSMMSEIGRDSVGAYAAAKGGLKMLTKNMATEWAKYNIQVNGIGPGYFETKLTEAIRLDGHPFNDFIVNRTPAGRWGIPSELAGTAIFLASKASDFITGQIIYVDGGILATLGKPQNKA